MSDPGNGGGVMRGFRKAMGLTQQQLADRASVSRSWISRAETGKVPLYDDGLTRLSACQHCGRTGGQVPVPEWERIYGVFVKGATARTLQAV